MSTNSIDTGALLLLRNTKHRLSRQQYRTLKGQVLAGDADGAMKGLRRILRRRAERMGGGQNEIHALPASASGD